MRPTWTRLQGVTMAPVRGTKDKRDSRRKIRKLVLNRAPLYFGGTAAKMLAVTSTVTM